MEKKTLNLEGKNAYEEVVKTGRLLLEGFIESEEKGRGSGHFLERGTTERKPDPNFKIDDLTDEDFFVFCKVMTKMITVQEFEKYKERMTNSAKKDPTSVNKSRHTLLGALNNLAGYLYI